MRSRCAVGVLTALAARVHAADQAPAFDFGAIGTNASDVPIGGLQPADVTGGSTTFLSSPTVSPTPSPSPTVSSSATTGFATDATGYNAARVNPDPVIAATTSPPTPTTPWVPSSVMPFGAADTPPPPVAVVTQPSSMAFSALPTSAQVDLQGYVFKNRAETAVATNASAANATADDGWWRERICASSPDACAVTPFDAGHAHRRLADSAGDAATGISDVEKSLNQAAVFKTASTLVTVGMAFASGPAAWILAGFAAVLTALFAESTKSAYINLLKAVNSQYVELNDVIIETGKRIAAAPDIRSMRNHVREAYKYDAAMRTMASGADAADKGALAIKYRGYCDQNNLHTKFYDALMDTDRYMAALETYYDTRSRGYVSECTFYLQGLYAAYMSYIKCALVTNPDLNTLKKTDKEIRDKLRKVASAMAQKALDMRQKFVDNVQTDVKNAVSDGGSEADLSALKDKYDWLEFRAYKSRSEQCAGSDNNVIDSRCGLIAMSEKTCHIVAWVTRGKEADKESTGQFVSGTGLYAKYREVPDNEKCGYGAEADQIVIKTRPPMRRLATSAVERLLAVNQFAGMNVFVRSTKASAVDVQIPEPSESPITKEMVDAAKDPQEEKLNNAKDEKERMKIRAEGYTNTSMMSQSIKSRDMAMWFTLEVNLKEVKDMYDERDTMVDGITTTVKDVHEIEMGRIKGINNDLVVTGTQEVQALVDLETQTTGQHYDELAQMDVIDNQLTTLSNTLTQGFSGTSSDIDAVESETTAALQHLSGTVQETGEKTRTEVKRVIAQATQKTLEHLDGLDTLIQVKSAEKLEAARGLQDLVASAGAQIRNGVANEFNARAEQLQQRVAGLTNHIYSAAQSTATALVSSSDALRTDLGRRIAFMTNQLEVIDSRIKATEQILTKMNTQLDDILGLIGKLNGRLSVVYRSLRDLPNRIRQVVMVKTVEDKFRDAERLSFAYANYIKNSMNQLQAFEFVQQCDAVGESLLFDNLLDRLKRGEAVLQKELATFNNSRVDYEQFGNRMIAAAYHLRYMLMPCGNMRTLLQSGRAAFTEATSRSQADKLNSAAWTFQQSMEETVPQLFLKKIYTATYLRSLVDDVRRSVATSDASAASDYSVTAIEPLRYQLQQHLGTFAMVSVIQPDQRSRLAVWSKSTKTSLGMSRFGMLRLSTMTSGATGTDELLVLYSNTRQQIPASLQDKFRIPLTKASLASDATVAAALKDTAYEPYYTAGLVQSIVFVERMNKTTCPWAISNSHYPFCWETGAYEDGGCVCVQLEGLDSAAPRLVEDAPSPYIIQTMLTGKTPATNPRADFVITASTKPVTTALATTAMLGVPENRRAFSICMAAPLPPRECIAGKWCHQPPPATTRCLTNPETTYKIVYPPEGTTPVFIDSGDSVTADMFRTMELGAMIPDITFFDSQAGDGNFIVCSDCTIDVLKSVYMFRVAAFKIGRPKSETTAICRQHPRHENVEFCARVAGAPDLWTPQTLLASELVPSLQQFGMSLPPGISDPQELAVAVNDQIQKLLGDDVAYFKVYIAKAGSFNATTNSNAYWTNLPTQTEAQERGWTVIPTLYSTIANNKALTFDALVMWSTLPVQERNFAKLVVDKKPSGQTLKGYLEASFAAYNSEKILRGFFSEPFDNPDCPVAGDTDHFAYCTPVPVDKMCLCVQLEDLPEEYTELYDGSAPNGKVVSFPLDDAQSAYVVGRTKGSFSLGSKQAVGTWDGFPMRNVSARSVCVSDYNHPELGLSCLSNDQSLAAVSSVRVGTGVASVMIKTATWTALCTGCSNAFVSQISTYGSVNATVTTGGLIAGGACRTNNADGGGQVQVCLNQNE